METENLTEKMRVQYKGREILEIAQRSNGNERSYIICNRGYEEILWQRDNQLNKEGSEFIGSSLAERI